MLPECKMTYNCKIWSSCKTKFMASCLKLCQMEFPHAFCDFLCALCSSHCIDLNAKRIPSKGCLRWKWKVLKVEVMTCFLSQAFGQTALACFRHLETPSSWHHNVWFPCAFWAKLTFLWAWQNAKGMRLKRCLSWKWHGYQMGVMTRFWPNFAA